MCENLRYELVYFKVLHDEQGCYWPTIYRAGAAVVSTIASRYFKKSEAYIRIHACGCYNQPFSCCGCILSFLIRWYVLQQQTFVHERDVTKP